MAVLGLAAVGEVAVEELGMEGDARRLDDDLGFDLGDIDPARVVVVSGGEGCSGMVLVVRDESGSVALGLAGTLVIPVATLESAERSGTGGTPSVATKDEPNALFGRDLEDALPEGPVPALSRLPIPREDEVLPALSR